MDFAGCVTEQLSAAQTIAAGLVSGGRGPKSERIEWLERQLQHMISELLALQADIESGWSFDASGGISGECEFEEIMDDYKRSISSLKGMIQSAKMISR